MYIIDKIHLSKDPSTQDTGVEVGASGWGLLYEQDNVNQVRCLHFMMFVINFKIYLEIRLLDKDGGTFIRIIQTM